MTKRRCGSRFRVAVLAVFLLCLSARAAGLRRELEPKEPNSDHRVAAGEENGVDRGQQNAGKAVGNEQDKSSEEKGIPLKANEVEVPDLHVPMAVAVPGKRATAAGLGFVHAFVASLSVIIVSELGDKTFFIAAIMAMRHARLTVFSGALAALAVMTVLSALLGYATTVIPRWFTYYTSTFLFALFGLRMLREGWNMSADEGQEELEEVQADLKRRDEEMEKASAATVTQDPESGIIRGGRPRKVLGLFSPILLQAFTLTFLAEWGDRSQITTIILAARENVLGVTIGGILGHALCTALAVIGGRMIAQRISARTVTLVGGVVFLIFALSALFISPD